MVFKNYSNILSFAYLYEHDRVLILYVRALSLDHFVFENKNVKILFRFCRRHYFDLRIIYLLVEVPVIYQLLSSFIPLKIAENTFYFVKKIPLKNDIIGVTLQ